MEGEENIDVAPSEENGNVPAEAPSQPIEAPSEPVVTAEPELYELPDGRKVDAETLATEWKEKFMPDYTRKSQALAAKETITNPQPAAKASDDPNWVPQSYAEVIKIAKEEMKADLEKEQQDTIARQQEIEQNVINELADIKKIDPAVNENALFLHANKYGFSNLSAAHQNMKDMADLAKNVQQTTVRNVAKRADPVSVSSGAAGGNKPNPADFASATDYLRSLQ